MRSDTIQSATTCLLAIFLATSCATTAGIPKQRSPATKAQGPKAYPKGGELLGRSTFTEPRSVPWLPFFEPPAKGEGQVKHGAYCLRIDKLGKNQWDVQLRHREMTIVNEHRYAVRFTAWSSAPVGIRAKVGMSGAPYTDYWSGDFDLTPTPVEYSDEFTAFGPDDPSAEFAFHLNDEQAKVPVEICFNELHLTDPAFVPSTSAAAKGPPAIRVNQLGYLPNAKKRATWVLTGSDAKQRAMKPMPFVLVDSAATVLYRGTTEPFGRDPTSDTYVQRIDFSSVATPGKDLRLQIVEASPDSTAVADKAGGATPSSTLLPSSDPFAIEPELYRALSRDALRYFYYTRSGIALEQPYVENPIWERVKGHPTDRQVSCASDAHCTYSLDVSGGWYDAGDYGKYVVNGGLSVWLLLNWWEYSQQKGLVSGGSRDGELNIPESGNGLPDLLDEARWELEWMLKMQVPEGQVNAGMVHHKMHDEAWSALGSLPLLLERTPRTLRPVSTAATLNLAATAAQASRVFARLDPKFAARCLAAATRAWQAAEMHPAMLITIADNRGGGAYEDADVSDERFWAASELYLSSRDRRYLEVLTRSPHYLRVEAQAAEPGLFQALDWRSTAALGNLSLLIATKDVERDVRERARAALVSVAERYLALVDGDAFGQPYVGTDYKWGSNSFMLNNGIILAYAHALTSESRFLDGAVAAMDYLLGRNALGKSYVSGYGQRMLTNPHHRMWAHAIAPKFPPPPPGVVAGGPNTSLQDPYSKAANVGCVGQMCYVDHIDAYSANEVAINWNAELAWLVAYLNATRARAH